MSEQFLYETFIPTIFIIVIASLCAEFIGRRKHIGRNYTFLMMLGIFPGIIALAFSPSAKNEPTKANKIYNFVGVFLFLTGISIFFKDIDHLNFATIFAGISIITSSFYCSELSGGKIINYEPKYYFENLTNKKTEHIKNLDFSISNLQELKEKGILTEKEYTTKVEKIKAEKDLQNLKNSIEYKQLKSLLDNGILSKEEFDNKIKIINSKN